MSHLTKQPNFLVIIADQWRYDWLGANGIGIDLSPHLDQLAHQGTLFERCFTPCPICSPARISLATGLDPERLGATDNMSSLPHSRRTWYQDLRDHGYRTGLIGKLDLDKRDQWNGNGKLPRTYAWGFTDPLECEGKMHAGKGSGEPIGPYQRMLQERGLLDTMRADYDDRAQYGWVGDSPDSPLPIDAWEDRFIGDQAAHWITSVERDAPWCLNVHFVGPHDPYDPPQDAAQRFRDVAMPETHGTGLPSWIGGHEHDLSPQQTEHARRQYAACCHAIDEQIGAIVKALDGSGQRDNTVILFSADHGEMLGDHKCWTKHVPLDASARIPLIAQGPGIRAGARSSAMVSLHDLGATVRELAGLDTQSHLDAKSFAHVLKADGVHRSACQIVEQGYRALRTEQHLYIEGRCGDRLVFDLEHDPWATQPVDDLALQRSLAGQLRELRTEAGCLR